MHGDVFKDGSRISATFKMELFSKIGNVRVYSQCTVALASVTQPFLQAKLRLDRNDHALKAALIAISYFCRYLKTKITLFH